MATVGRRARGADLSAYREVLALLASPPSPWRERAACRGMATRIFFEGAAKATARAVCARCPVRAACLTEALRIEAAAPYMAAGVYGGLDERERAQLQRVAV
jgi:WhiB family redox-sensing transcriptional regulator